MARWGRFGPCRNTVQAHQHWGRFNRQCNYTNAPYAHCSAAHAIDGVLIDCLICSAARLFDLLLIDKPVRPMRANAASNSDCSQMCTARASNENTLNNVSVPRSRLDGLGKRVASGLQSALMNYYYECCSTESFVPVLATPEFNENWAKHTLQWEHASELCEA